LPIDLNIQVSDYQDVSVWTITETIQELRKGLDLNGQEEMELSRIKHEKGKKQWLAVRQLAKKVLKTGDQIIYNDFGVPHLKGHDFHISLSHSEEKVALSFNRDYETGIDIQYKNQKILNIKRKFTSDFELDWIPSEKESDFLHILWGAKEAMFKYYTCEMPFKMAEVQAFELRNQGVINTVRKRADKKDIFQLTYRIFEGYYLVYLSDLISIEIGTRTNKGAETER